jgi:hypothetical protein
MMSQAVYGMPQYWLLGQAESRHIRGNVRVTVFSVAVGIRLTCLSTGLDGLSGGSHASGSQKPWHSSSNIELHLSFGSRTQDHPSPQLSPLDALTPQTMLFETQRPDRFGKLIFSLMGRTQTW